MNPIPTSLLIVDDDPVFARFARQLVQSLGAEMPCATRWVDTAGKALAEVMGNSFDLVLLDYHLPDGDGLQVLDEIRKIPPPRQPAVIMLTASGNEAIAVEAMKRGARDYLTKAELDLPPLMRAMQTALSQKRLAEQVAAYNTQMESDLKMARNLQQSLLPDRYPVFPGNSTPENSALQFHHCFLPASQLAGDFFNVLNLSDKMAGVFICDVMGHGVRSALVTAMLRALVDDLAPRTHDPGAFLAEINHRLAGMFKQAGELLFATAFYLIADLEAGQMRYANAGHPRPIHLQPRTGLAAPLALPPHPGAALGLFPDSKYLTSQCPLAPGDSVLLFTDGLFEVAEFQADTDFGQERLLEAARKRIHLPLPELLDGIVGEVRAFSGGGEFSDDVCLLGMKRTI